MKLQVKAMLASVLASRESTLEASTDASMVPELNSFLQEFGKQLS